MPSIVQMIIVCIVLVLDPFEIVGMHGSPTNPVQIHRHGLGEDCLRRIIPRQNHADHTFSDTLNRCHFVTPDPLLFHCVTFQVVSDLHFHYKLISALCKN